MGQQKIKTPFPGVRYYEHPTRKMKNGQPDRYFSIRYRKDGVGVEEALGWASEGWTAEKAHHVRSQVRTGQRVGSGPASVAEMRAEADARRKAAQEAARQDALAGLTLGAFLEQHYLPHARKTKRSWRTDAQRIAKHIVPALGLLPLTAVTKDHLQALVDDLVESGAAPATVKQYYGIVRNAFNVARELTLDGRPLFDGPNPAQGVKLPTVRNDRERFLTAEEAARLIEGARHRRSPDLHDAIVLSLNTGLRLGELRRLLWPDVDLAHGILTVREEDRRKPGGKIPLNQAATAIFQARLDRHQAGSLLVFPPSYGDGLRENLTNDFHDLAESLGLNAGLDPKDRARRIVFHSLRHTFASWLALAGTDIYRIKTLMRHKNIAMTMRYAHLLPDATRDAVHNLKPPSAVAYNS
ncbi:tyrosine-type recombinase/integrase [Megalodesulfovibrio paquesii]